MDLSALFKRAGQVAAEKSPAILTAIGVTGTLTTAYLAAKAAFASVEVLKEAEENKQAEFLGTALQEVAEGEEPVGVTTISPEPLTFEEKFNAVWTLYVPAAASAAMTVTAIICAGRVSDRRAVAMASAYSVVEKNFKEYRAKTASKIGKKKEQEIRDEIAQERVDRHPTSRTETILTKDGTQMCYDPWSDRYFTSDVETIRSAVNDFNAKVINESYASLSEFWHMIGLGPTKNSDRIGWSTDALLDVDYSFPTVNGNPVCYVDFRVEPTTRYADFH